MQIHLLLVACACSIAAPATAGAEDCPSAALPGYPDQVWTGQKFVLKASVTGAPASVRWQRSGVDISDDTRIQGSATATLTVGPASATDTGVYRLRLTGSCGPAYSPEVQVVVKAPPPTAGQWTVSYLHPSWARWSQATAVRGGRQGGSVGVAADPAFPHVFYPVHAAVWSGTAASAVDVNPAGAVGSRIYTISSAAAAGSWQEPDAPPATTWDETAAVWTLPGLGFSSYGAPSGKRARITAAAAEGMAGAVWYFDQTGIERYKATLWNSGGTVSLHPDGLYWSFATGLSGRFQFGWTQSSYGASPRAAVWTGTPESLQDLAPVGSSGSQAMGAGSGQAAGYATIQGQKTAGVWGSAPGTFTTLHPTAAGSSEARAAYGGLQAGWQAIGAQTRACIWAGSAGSVADLHASLQTGYSDSMAEAIDVGENGVVWVAGSAFNKPKGRYEALLWRLAPPSRPLHLRCKDAASPAVAAHATRRHFTLTGRTSSVEPDRFTIVDGSGQLLVVLPHHGLGNGQWVQATGAIDTASGTACLAADSARPL